MNTDEFKKLAKDYNLKIKKEEKILQSGITEGKNSNNKILKLLKNSQK